MATQNAINTGDSARTATGISAWGGAGGYFTDTTIGEFRLDRPGTGFVMGKPVAWTAPQTVTGLAVGNCYFIYVDSTGTIGKTTDEDVAYGGTVINLFECLRDSTSGTNVQVTVREDHPYTVDYAANHYLHDAIGPIIENKLNGANLIINGGNIQKVDITGTDYLLDHGLTTQISAASPVTFHKMYITGGKWAHQGTVTNPGDTFGGYWNNAGTVTQLTGAANNKFCVYTFYVSKDNATNPNVPLYFALLGLAKYDKQADAQTAISTGTNISFASGELAQLELCLLGYGIYSQPAAGFVQIVIAKKTLNAQTSSSGTNTASLISTSTTNFDGFLSASDTNVQAALETLDDWAKMTDGYLMIGRTGTSPVKATLTAGAGITITPASGAITVAYNGGSGSVSTLTGGSGGAISPSAGNITLAGGTNIATSGSGSTITFGITGTVGIANGGTNASSMANNYGTVYYNGTSLVTVSPGTQDYVLTSNGASAAPSYQLVPGTLAWSTTSSTSFTAVANKGYILTSTSKPVVDMPTTPSIGDSIGVIKIVTGGFQIQQAASQKTYFSTAGATTAGVGHGIDTYTDVASYRMIRLTYVASNTWYVTEQSGSFVTY